jgi:hypothetical protein
VPSAKAGASVGAQGLSMTMDASMRKGSPASLTLSGGLIRRSPPSSLREPISSPQPAPDHRVFGLRVLRHPVRVSGTAGLNHDGAQCPSPRCGRLPSVRGSHRWSLRAQEHR